MVEEYTWPERRCNHEEIEKKVNTIWGWMSGVSILIVLLFSLFYGTTSSAIDRTEQGISDMNSKLDRMSKQVSDIANSVSVINERTKTNRDEIRSLREKQGK